MKPNIQDQRSRGDNYVYTLWMAGQDVKRSGDAADVTMADMGNDKCIKDS